jgi:hypothetical protein
LCRAFLQRHQAVSQRHTSGRSPLKKNLTGGTDLRIRLSPTDAGPNAADDDVVQALPFTLCRWAKRCPEVCGGLEFLGCYTDDFVRHPRDRHPTPDDTAIGPKRSLPHVVTQNRERWAAGDVFFGSKFATEEQGNSEKPKESGTDTLLTNVGRMASHAEIQVLGTTSIHGEIDGVFAISRNA